MFTAVMVMTLEFSMLLPPVLQTQRTDAHGDPLPPGALLRLGTTRLGHFSDISWVGFAHDDQTVITASMDRRLRWWKAATGKETGYVWGGVLQRDSFALSADGKTLALPNYEGDCLMIVDAITRKEFRRLTYDELVGPKDERFYYGARFVFSPDGRFLAIWDRHRSSDAERKEKKLRSFTLLRLWDLKSGRRIHEWKTGDLFEAEFSPDGKTLFAQERDPKTAEASLRSWEVGSGQELRRTLLPCPLLRYFPRPDGKTMLGLSEDRRSLALFDITTGKEQRSIVDKGGPIYTIALSPDGKALAYEQGGRIIVLGLDSGKVALTVPVASPPLPIWIHMESYNRLILGQVAFSPSGKVLAIANGRRLELWDLASGLRVHASSDVMQGPLQGIHVQGDHLVARDLGPALSLWDLRTGKILRRFVNVEPTDMEPGIIYSRGHLDSYYCGEGMQAISPDGRTLAALWIRAPIQLFDLGSGKRLRLLEGSERATCLAFSPDGKHLAGPTRDSRICLWDTATGKQVLHLSGGYQPDSNDRLAYDRLSNVLALRFSPDGRILAGSWSDEVLFWEVASGTLRRRLKSSDSELRRESYGDPSLEGADSLTMSFAFSPDGKHVAGAGPRNIRIWDVLTGKEVRRLGGLGIAGQTAVYTPDGKYLAAGLENGGIRFWNAATGDFLHDVPAHENIVTCLCVPKGGKTLVSASLDGTALVWDLGTLLKSRPASAKQTKGDLEPLWNDLGSADGEKALEAMQAFAARPKEAVELFDARLQPVALVDPERIRQWVTDLQTDRFATREQAARELERLGEMARPALEKALAGTATLETRRRVELLLGKLAPPISGTESLRAIRAVEVLERIGTKEARRLLEKLAAGARGPRLTEDARTALERLSGR